MSQCRHRECGYLVAVDSATRLPPPRSDDTVAAGPPLLIHQTTSVHLLYFFELIEQEKIIFHVRINGSKNNYYYIRCSNSALH